jgi:CO/xanthine dehydrogenase FAD-binding subunit
MKVISWDGARPLAVMKPAAFEYVVANSIEQAVAVLAQAGGDAKILAGGQSLVPMLNFRLFSSTSTAFLISRLSRMWAMRSKSAH